jgi:hypothetical protein
MALIAFLSSILGRPSFFFFLGGGSKMTILSHKISGISYRQSTPVISDIKHSQEIRKICLALSM